MAQSKIEGHLELCPLQNGACDYSGCTMKLLRKDKEHHNCVNMVGHLDLVSKNLKQSQQDLFFISFPTHTTCPLLNLPKLVLNLFTFSTLYAKFVVMFIYTMSYMEIMDAYTVKNKVS